MKITYAITVCNEFIEIQKLIGFLLEHKRLQDNIIVLFDSKNGSIEVETVLQHYSKLDWFKWYKSDFNGHFADWKNYLTSLCTGDYIFQIDADELPHEKLIEVLPDLLEENCMCDVITVPRVNTVEGISQDHMQQWGWNVNENGWINWPDYQWRIYKNQPHIKWINKVHERIEGHKIWTHLPMIEEFSLYHPKTIDRQIRQNNYYNTL
jgi:hypothetical protein